MKLIVPLIAPLALCGCFLASPDAAHIQADREFYETIEPILAPLVDNDPETTSPELSEGTQDAVRGALDNYLFMLERHEAAGSTQPGDLQ